MGFFDNFFDAPEAPAAPNYQPLIDQAQALQQPLLANNTYALDQSRSITGQYPQAQQGAALAQGQLPLANQGYQTAMGQLPFAYQGFGESQIRSQQFNDYAQAANDLMRQQYDWARQTYAENKGVTDNIVNSFIGQQNRSMSQAAEDRARYRGVFQPLEDKLVAEANDYASQGRMDLNRGRARAQVAQDFEAQRQNTMRDLESYGINPGAVRYAGLDSGIRAQQGAAEAAAANQADLQTEATARALREQAIALGRQYPGQALAEEGMGLNAGQAAGNLTLAQSQVGSQIMNDASRFGVLGAQYGGVGANYLGQGANYLNAGNSALGQGANYLNSGTGALNSGANYLNSGTGMYNSGANYLNSGNSALGYATGAIGQAGRLTGQGYTDQLNQFNAEQNSSSGLGTLLGVGASLAKSYLSPAPIKLAGGGEVPGQAPGQVPQFMSPSGGQATDDVPARLTAGEFVLPRDVTSWYGEEKLQKMIEKARQAKGGAKAKPQFALPRG